ncbi:MAG: hypothetical protein KC983_09755 [Phycisphaerales bacterium]|nr:hypothetical protein [Phycisphaerales bacterium]
MSTLSTQLSMSARTVCREKYDLLAGVCRKEVVRKYPDKVHFLDDIIQTSFTECLVSYGDSDETMLKLPQWIDVFKTISKRVAIRVRDFAGMKNVRGKPLRQDLQEGLQEQMSPRDSDGAVEFKNSLNDEELEMFRHLREMQGNPMSKAAKYEELGARTMQSSEAARRKVRIMRAKFVEHALGKAPGDTGGE